jgi:Fe-S cluster assembly ATP-binding protein
MRQKINSSSILIISHQERILNIADEIIVIKDGSVVKRGSKDEVLPELMGTASAVPGCNKVEMVREAKKDA